MTNFSLGVSLTDFKDLIEREVSQHQCEVVDVNTSQELAPAVILKYKDTHVVCELRDPLESGNFAVLNMFVPMGRSEGLSEPELSTLLNAWNRRNPLGKAVLMDKTMRVSFNLFLMNLPVEAVFNHIKVIEGKIQSLYTYIRENRASVAAPDTIPEPVFTGGITLPQLVTALEQQNVEIVQVAEPNYVVANVQGNHLSFMTRVPTDDKHFSTVSIFMQLARQLFIQPDETLLAQINAWNAGTAIGKATLDEKGVLLDLGFVVEDMPERVIASHYGSFLVVANDLMKNLRVTG